MSLNVITSKPQKELLLDLICQIPNIETKKEYLEKLKGIILEEEDKPPKFKLGPSSSSSLTQIFERYPITNPYQQVSTKQLQSEINDLKSQVRFLKSEVSGLKTKDLEIETKIALLESFRIDPPAVLETENISGIQETEIPETQFLQTISKVTFQKWYSVVTLVVNDFSINVVALIDSGADQNCIKTGIVPTKFCERTREQLVSANGEPLNIRSKLNKGYIQNSNYCFKKIFLIVDNISNDVILATPFLTQIYPFTVNETGVHTKIMGNTISFPFLSSAHQKEILSLQASSIFKQINSLQIKRKQICHLQEEISYLRIEEQLQNPSLLLKIKDFSELIKKRICSDLPNAFWERKKHIISLPYEPDFDERNIPTKARPTQMNFELLEHCKREILSLIHI